jgi:hypothetical protein
MDSSSRPLVYLVLGTPGSGRRAILSDLIADGLTSDDRPLTALPDAEGASEWDARLGRTVQWSWRDGGFTLELPRLARGETADFTHLFIVADGRRNPVDQIESFRDWLRGRPADLARIITVVNCALVHAHDAAIRPWIDACIHFSDVVLLASREGVPNKWMSDFQAHYRDAFMPALFEFVKQGRVKNPVMVLEPEARRLSQAFDEASDLAIARELAPEAEITFTDESGDDEEDAGEQSPPGADDDESPAEAYFERRQNGRRTIELPDIARFLPPTPTSA